MRRGPGRAVGGWAESRRVLRRGWVAGLLFSASAAATYGLFSQLSAAGPAEPPVAVSEAPAEPASQPGWVATPAPGFQGPVRPEPTGEGTPDDPIRVLTGRIAPGGTLAEAMAERQVSAATVYELTSAIRPVFDFRLARPGDFFSLILAPDDSILSFEFKRGRRQVYRVWRAEGTTERLQAEASEVPLERRVVHLSGVIDRSLFKSVLALGQTADLVSHFVEIFQWDFDFSKQTRPGDRFDVEFEKFSDNDGFVRSGTILAARYRSQGENYTAIYFEDEDGYGDYYHPDGTSLRRAFLRAPVKYSRISSGYSRSRLHPILKVRRAHLGIDYAAPRGTPVWAVADGKVTFKSWNGGFGRMIKIRHNNGFVSSYGHLSRFAAGLHVGDRVQQKQVIGYVGSTGLATGPHVDFRLKTDRGFVNPLKVHFPKGKPISVQEHAAFERTRDRLLAQLDGEAPDGVLEARHSALAE